MRIQLFRVEEANQALADLRPRLERLRAQKREFDRLDTRTSVLLVATAGTDPRNPDAIELAALGEKRRRLGEIIARGLQELSDLGVVVRDLDRGLIDFYSLAGDRLVFLCWHLGETEITHWHGIQEGFSARKPLKNAELE